MAFINWPAIRHWLLQNKGSCHEYVEMARERLEGDCVQIIVAIFDAEHKPRLCREWIGIEDDQIRQIFGTYDYIQVDL